MPISGWKLSSCVSIVLARTASIWSGVPVMVDPSHAAGTRSLVPALSRAGLAAGADGLIVEAHPDPVNAYSDATQQLESSKFGEFLKDLEPWIALTRESRKSNTF